MDDLFSILPKDVSMERCYDRNYTVWEQEVADPILAALGFEVVEWKHGELDSFGPLSRVVVVTNSEGQRLEFVYA